MQAAGFEEPRPIQKKTISAVLERRDVLGLAPTGTGKTAAFALPILTRLLARKGQGRVPRALILAPTRELASQINAEIELLGRFTPLRSTAVFGGVPVPRQVRALKQRPDILVACPGRLLDLHERGDVDLRGVEILVLDEADHMFDMGFLPSIRRILSKLPEKRQNLLFSATMPREIRRLTDDVLHRPHVVELAHSAPADTIEHAIYPVADARKQDLLEHLLDEPDFRSAIVFLRTKFRAKRLAQRLARRGLNAVALQGNMSQSQRERAMSGFRSGDYDVLVATDIAARGIDVAGVSHVINFDVPNTSDAYTHRIGRTGRAERQGKACTFATPADRAQIRAIENKLGAPISVVHLKEFGGRPERRERDDARGRTGARGSRNDTRSSSRPPRCAPAAKGRGSSKAEVRRRQESPVSPTAKAQTSGRAWASGIDADPNLDSRAPGPKKPSKNAKRRKRMANAGSKNEGAGHSLAAKRRRRRARAGNGS